MIKEREGRERRGTGEVPSKRGRWAASLPTKLETPGKA